MKQCEKGHPLREVARARVRETVEDVVHVVRTIKHFNREGSEEMREMKIPEFVEREVDVDRIEYFCDECRQTVVLRENEVTIS